MTGATVLLSHRLAEPLQRRTGLGRYQQSLTAALATAGGRYVLAAPREPGPDPTWCPVPVVRVRGPRNLVQAAWAAAGRPHVERLLPRDLAPALVHVLDATVAARSRVPLVHTVHDLFPRTHPHWETVRGRVLFAAVARAVRAADRVITPSRAVADQVTHHLEVPARRVDVVPEGVDDRFRRAEPRVPASLAARGVTAGGYWVAVGRPGPRKNLAVLVDALARASSRRPLVLAGPDGPETEALRSRASERGVTIHLAGFVSDDDLPGLLAGARALLHPALEEGFGLPPLEAMATGVPAVVSPSAAVLEVVSDAAMRCPPDDVTAWAAALDVLDRDDALVADLGRAGRARAAGYTWDAAAAATAEVHATCLR